MSNLEFTQSPLQSVLLYRAVFSYPCTDVLRDRTCTIGPQVRMLIRELGTQSRDGTADAVG